MKQKEVRELVAFAQSNPVFELERDETGLSTGRDYLRVSKDRFLTTQDGKKLYKYIVRWYFKGVSKILLHTDSKVTEECILYMLNRAKKVPGVKKMMNKLMIVNTYSNADTTRDKLKEAYLDAAEDGINCRMYFALSRLSSVVKTTNRGQISADGTIDQLVVISNDAGPFAEQLWDSYRDNRTDTKKIRMADFTIDVLNEFKGNQLTIVAVSEADFTKVNKILPASNYTGAVTFYECVRPDLVIDVIESTKFEKVTSLASAVAISAKGYAGLSPTISYESTCAAFAQIDNWDNLVKAKVIRPVCEEE